MRALRAPYLPLLPATSTFVKNNKKQYYVKAGFDLGHNISEHSLKFDNNPTPIGAQHEQSDLSNLQS